MLRAMVAMTPKRVPLNNPMDFQGLCNGSRWKQT
jgi:hypothetical protein